MGNQGSCVSSSGGGYSGSSYNRSSSYNYFPSPSSYSFHNDIPKIGLSLQNPTFSSPSFSSSSFTSHNYDLPKSIYHSSNTFSSSLGTSSRIFSTNINPISNYSSHNNDFSSHISHDLSPKIDILKPSISLSTPKSGLPDLDFKVPLSINTKSNFEHLLTKSSPFNNPFPLKEENKPIISKPTFSMSSMSKILEKPLLTQKQNDIEQVFPTLKTNKINFSTGIKNNQIPSFLREKPTIPLPPSINFMTQRLNHLTL